MKMALGMFLSAVFILKCRLCCAVLFFAQTELQA